MFGIVNYRSFVLAAVLLNLTPGADTIYILTKSAAGGRRQGIASALGISTGTLVHTFLAAFGLSAILATSAAAFTAMKTLGAAYLLFMGLRSIFKKEPLFAAAEPTGGNALTAYRQGILTNVLNPKVALFFLALLPQYVSPDSPYGPLSFLLLGLTFVCTGTLWCITVACLSAMITGFLTRSEKTGSLTNKVTGCIYITLGLNVLRAKLSD